MVSIGGREGEKGPIRAIKNYFTWLFSPKDSVVSCDNLYCSTKLWKQSTQNQKNKLFSEKVINMPGTLLHQGRTTKGWTHETSRKKPRIPSCWCIWTSTEWYCGLTNIVTSHLKHETIRYAWIAALKMLMTTMLCEWREKMLTAAIFLILGRSKCHNQP